MSLASKYVSLVRAETGYLPTYPPTLDIDVGDLVRIDDGITGLRGRSDETFAVTEVGAKWDREFSSLGTTRQYFAAGVGSQVSGLPVARAGLDLNFESGFGVYCKFRSSYERTVIDPRSLEEDLLRRYRDGTAEPNEALVTSVVHCEAFAVVISAEKGARLVLECNDEGTLVEDLPFGGKMGIAVSKGRVEQWITLPKEGMTVTPFFRAIRVQDRRILAPKALAAGEQETTEEEQRAIEKHQKDGKHLSIVNADLPSQGWLSR